MKKRITLLNNARLSDLKFEYLTTLISQKVPKSVFVDVDHLTIDLTYYIGEDSFTIFRLFNVKVGSIDELVKLILHHTSEHRDLKFDRIRLYYRKEAK